VNAPQPLATTPHREFGGTARPSLAQWLKPPANRWAFRHTRELFRSERVAASDPARMQTAPTTDLDPDLLDYFDRSHTDAVAVMHNGSLAWDWYAEGVAVDDRHILFSVSKSVVGLVASALITQGVLDDARFVVDYIPEVAGGGYGTTTVRHLLDMTANVAFDEDYEGDDLRRYREASGQLPSDETTGIRDFVAGLPQDGPHGQATRYVSPTTDLAGWVCERVAGQSLASLISTYVWGPMGAQADGDLLLDRFGTARASGGLCATVQDMARIGQILLLDDDVLPHAADVKSPGDKHTWDAGSLADFLPGAAYRDFWYQPERGSGIFLAAGIYGQRIYVDSVRRVVIAQQSSLPGAYDATTWMETLPRFAAIARALSQE
jgi:CubicO group peptidase (beta-lactamase class C family)